ncbi:stage V sporulation protein AE [Clostridium sp. DL1XJH146]
MIEKRKVIVVTDGDRIAKKAVEKASMNNNCRCISASAGNPTKIDYNLLIKYIQKTPYGPVVVMLDDRGHTGKGKGEVILEKLLKSKEVDVIGLVAVASNTERAKGIEVDCSIDKFKTNISTAVDKHGNGKFSKILMGDTINTIKKNKDLFVVGIGDPGKMDGFDYIEYGCPVLSKAIAKIIMHN